MNKKNSERIFTRPFSMSFPDPSADNGIATLKFDPFFDCVPSTKEFVNTKEKGQKYFDEVCKPYV